MVTILGGVNFGAVTLSRDEIAALQKLYKIVPEKHRFLEAGALRNLSRHAEVDGLRMIAWIAKYLDAGEDPVRALISFAIEAGVDVEPSDQEWIDPDNFEWSEE